MRELEKFTGRITALFSLLAQFALAAVMFLIVANIIFRRFVAPIPGTVEIVELGGALILGSSIAYCLYNGGHIFVDVLVQRLPEKHQKFVDFLGNLLMLILNGLIAWQMYIYGARMLSRGIVTGHLEIPTGPVIYVIAIGFLMMAMVNLTHVLNSASFLLRGGKK